MTSGNVVLPPRFTQRGGLDDSDIERVRKVLWLNGLRGADLEDGVQEVHLRHLQRAPVDLESPGAWACAVATNVALDHHRRTSRRTAIEYRLRPTTRSEAGPDVALAHAVAQALARLDPDLRAVVVLRFYADLPVATIAAHLGIPAGTVKSRLHRAVGELRSALPEEDL
ncbi:MAG TPA: sigma-70 family RNA polymerase sigma factor [Acidimicrobiia bacterium]|nr:sigma-70 family RNA polymerase sigma factor [Acidimicrobiia bacterium]